MGLKSWLKSRLSVSKIAAMRRMMNLFQFAIEYIIDAKRFFLSSSVVIPPDGQGQLAAHLIMDYHRLEKGLALPAPRVGFGRDVVDRLMKSYRRYVADFGTDAITATVCQVLCEYHRKQVKLGYCNADLEKFIKSIEIGEPGKGGVEPVDRKILFPFDRSSASKFLTSRRSVRQYTGELVSDDDVRTISRIAQCAPSVCNRQSGRIYCANTRENINKLLELQNGNRGFGDKLGAVFVLTSDLRSFTSLGERNQGYVDGGIFAMQALLAIHALGFGGCMLNWSATSVVDRKLRKILLIPDHEIVITMIGFGHCLENFEVASSPRLDEDLVFKFYR